MSTLTEQQKHNLLDLALFLGTKITDEQFNMETYRQNGFGRHVLFNSKTDCGTVGCALGWGPFVVTPQESHFITSIFTQKLQLSFVEYQKEFINGYRHWDYCFHSDLPSDRIYIARRLVSLVMADGDVDKAYKHLKKLEKRKEFKYV